MSCVARTGEEGIASVDLAREEHPVAVVREECILYLVESLEILCPCHAYCRTVVAVAPCDEIFVFNLAYARVVTVYPFPDFRDVALESERLRVEVPLQPVL